VTDSQSAKKTQASRVVGVLLTDTGECLGRVVDADELTDEMWQEAAANATSGMEVVLVTDGDAHMFSPEVFECRTALITEWSDGTFEVVGFVVPSTREDGR
jgi:uncharacterized protein